MDLERTGTGSGDVSGRQVRGRILVIRGGAIGDFILTLPVFSALREAFPDTHLEVLGYSHITRLALAGDLVDDVESIESRALAGFFASKGELDDAVAAYFARFDVIVSYLYDPDGIFQKNVSRCSKAQFIAGPHRPDEKEWTHAAEVFLKPLEAFALFDACSSPRLTLPVKANLPSDRYDLDGVHWLALHPGSGSSLKNWSEENWKVLCQYLTENSNLNLLIVGGEAEVNLIHRLSDFIPPGRHRLALNHPLPALAAVLQLCRGFIGHDSGISHLAAAVGLPAVILWGPSNKAIWQPRGERIRVVESVDGLNGIRLEQVLFALAETIPGAGGEVLNLEE